MYKIHKTILKDLKKDINKQRNIYHGREWKLVLWKYQLHPMDPD